MFHMVKSQAEVDTIIAQLWAAKGRMDKPKILTANILRHYLCISNPILVNIVLDEKFRGGNQDDVEATFTFCTKKDAKRIVYAATNKDRTCTNGYEYITNKQEGLDYVDQSMEAAEKWMTAGDINDSVESKRKITVRASMQSAMILSTKGSLKNLGPRSFPALMTCRGYCESGHRLISFPMVTRSLARTLVYYGKNFSAKPQTMPKSPKLAQVDFIARSPAHTVRYEQSPIPGSKIEVVLQGRKISASLKVDLFRGDEHSFWAAKEREMREVEMLELNYLNRAIKEHGSFSSVDNAVAVCRQMIYEFRDFRYNLRYGQNAKMKKSKEIVS